MDASIRGTEQRDDDDDDDDDEEEEPRAKPVAKKSAPKTTEDKSSKEAKKKPAKKDKNAPKKGRTAYMYFFEEVRFGEGSAEVDLGWGSKGVHTNCKRYSY